MLMAASRRAAARADTPATPLPASPLARLAPPHRPAIAARLSPLAAPLPRALLHAAAAPPRSLLPRYGSLAAGPAHPAVPDTPVAHRRDTGPGLLSGRADCPPAGCTGRAQTLRRSAPALPGSLVPPLLLPQRSLRSSRCPSALTAHRAHRAACWAVRSQSALASRRAAAQATPHGSHHQSTRWVHRR